MTAKQRFAVGEQLRVSNVAWFGSLRFTNGACLDSAIAPRFFDDNEQFRKPLAPTFTAVSFPLPFQSQMLIRTSRSGTSFVFQDPDDFLANYSVIFSDRITRHILADTPIEASAGKYEIRWRADGLRTLRFERIEDIGYKFAGLQWEP